MALRSLPLVVLVEDSDDDAFFFERTLRKCDIPHTYLRLGDGGAALRYLEKKMAAAANGEGTSSTVLFLDLKLPFLSGFEILRGLWIKTR